MPKFRNRAGGSVVSVDDATAERLDPALWESLDEKPKAAPRKAATRTASDDKK